MTHHCKRCNVTYTVRERPAKTKAQIQRCECGLDYTHSSNSRFAMFWISPEEHERIQLPTPTYGMGP